MNDSSVILSQSVYMRASISTRILEAMLNNEEVDGALNFLSFNFGREGPFLVSFVRFLFSSSPFNVGVLLEVTRFDVTVDPSDPRREGSLSFLTTLPSEAGDATDFLFSRFRFVLLDSSVLSGT